MTTRRFRVRSAIVAALIVSLGPGPGLGVAASAQQAGQGSIRGFLYDEDEVTKITGGRVTAVDIRTGRKFESNPTGKNGAYEIPDLPAGTYDIVMEAEGAFITNTLIDLSAGQHMTLSLSRKPRQMPDRTVSGVGKPKGTAVPTSNLRRGGIAGGPAKSYWRSAPGIILLSVLGAGAAATIVNALNDDDKKASVSAP